MERAIRTLSDRLVKNLSGSGSNWPLYVNAACYAHNTFINTRLGFSPFELVFLQKPAPLTEFEFDPNDHLPSSYEATEFLKLMAKRRKLMMDIVVERRTEEQQLQHKRSQYNKPVEYLYKIGDLVYLYAPGYSNLNMASRKIKQDYIGPFQVTAILDKSHYFLADLKGKLLPFISSTVHARLIKPCYVNLGEPTQMVPATVNNSKGLEHEFRMYEPP